MQVQAAVVQIDGPHHGDPAIHQPGFCVQKARREGVDLDPLSLIHISSTAVRLGGYQSVARPAVEKTQPVQMQMVTVGPISNGDAARLYALCGDLGLVESGLYHAAYTEV